MRSSFLTVTLLTLTLLCVGQTPRPQPEDTGAKVIAEVLGKPITARETNNLTRLILGSLLDQFAKENRIEPTPEELDALLRKTDETTRQQQLRLQAEQVKLTEELKSPSLSAGDREKKEARLRKVGRLVKWLTDVERESKETPEQARAMQRQTVEPIVKSWKVNQALYRKYGGRVVFQQAGVEPLDAYREFLEEQEKKGAFKILDEACRARFWDYFTNDAGRSFYSREEGMKVINTPWWTIEPLPAQ